MHEHPNHGLSKQAACSSSTKLYEEPKFLGIAEFPMLDKMGGEGPLTPV
jgi:hypothetical protein